MTHALERYKKSPGDGPASTLDLETWNGVLDTVGPLLAQLIQKGADFDAVSATAIGVLLDRINSVLSPAYDQVATRGAQVEQLYAQLAGTGVSAAAVLETTDRLFLTPDRRAAILGDLRGVVDAAHDTLGELAALVDAAAAAAASKADAGGTATALGNRLRGDAEGGYAAAVVDQFRRNLGGILPRGHISALGLANNASDATNDIDIAPGKARDSGDAVDLILTAGLTKQLDAVWTVGTNTGGRDTGTIADGTWHIWLIGRTDGAARDVLFSLSATAPTMPAGYTFKRRIGSILRASGAIKPFLQAGDGFHLTAANDYSSTAARAMAPLALSVPAGIVVRPVLTLYFQMNGSQGLAYITMAPGANALLLWTVSSTNNPLELVTSNTIGPPTNVSKQINLQVDVGPGALIDGRIQTAGWYDRRGQDD